MTKLIKNWRQIIISLGVMLFILTSCQPAKKPETPTTKEGNVEKPNTPPIEATIETTTETTQTVENTTPLDNPLVLPPIIPSNGSSNNSTPNTTSKNPTVGTSPETNATVQSSTGSMDRIYDNLQAYASQGQSYYVKNSTAEGLLTRGGKLYNSKGTPVNAAFLDSNTTVNSTLENFACDVLLIKGNDLLQYEGSIVPSGSSELSVYTAIKIAGNNKILLASATGPAGSITLDDYRKLLRSYSQNHGTIGLPVAGSEKYERILNFLRVHEGIYGDYFVREMKVDQKYAMVTLSPQTNALDIKQYILVNDNNFWEVALSGLEKEYHLQTAVNQALPDFNLGLLPSFSIAGSKNDLKADNSAVFKVLIYNGLIESTSQIYYACGTTDYCYIVLYDNTKFLAMRSGQNWKIEEVPSSHAALTLLQEDGGQSAAFILLDNDKASQ